MKKLLIITGIILLLVWIFKKNKTTAATTNNNGTGTGSGNGSGSTGTNADPSEYTTRPANTKPQEGIYIVNPIIEPTKPVEEDPAVIASPSVFPKPSTAEVSPLLQNINLKK